MKVQLQAQASFIRPCFCAGMTALAYILTFEAPHRSIIFIHQFDVFLSSSNPFFHSFLEERSSPSTYHSGPGMAIGIIFGNNVPSTGPSSAKGESHRGLDPLWQEPEFSLKLALTDMT
jgi:hypothetical protein